MTKLERGQTPVRELLPLQDVGDREVDAQTRRPDSRQRNARERRRGLVQGRLPDPWRVGERHHRRGQARDGVSVFEECRDDGRDHILRLLQGRGLVGTTLLRDGLERVAEGDWNQRVRQVLEGAQVQVRPLQEGRVPDQATLLH